jgi:hypothetical protein
MFRKPFSLLFAFTLRPYLLAPRAPKTFYHSNPNDRPNKRIWRTLCSTLEKSTICLENNERPRDCEIIRLFYGTYRSDPKGDPMAQRCFSELIHCMLHNMFQSMPDDHHRFKTSPFSIQSL